MAKIKAVAASPELPEEVLELKPLSSDAAVLNVHGRLCNSNPVKDAMPSALADIQRGLGIKVEEGKGTKKQRLRAKDYAKADANEELRDPRRPQEKLAAAATARNTDSTASEDEDAGGVMLNGGEESEDSFARYQGRLGSSDDDDASDVGSDVGDLERQLAAEGIRQSKSGSQKPTQTAYDPAADLSLSEDEASESQSPEPQKAPAPKKSSFLPSLTMGGYISGSGSEPESDVDVAPKKNRRGQRARQALWEKKFGQKAKHLQNTKRNEGWDPKRGATDVNDRPGKKGGKFKDKRVGGKSTSVASKSSHGAEAAKKHRDDKGPIHPSWEAAKKAKEKKESNAAFAGKKITFD